MSNILPNWSKLFCVGCVDRNYKKRVVYVRACEYVCVCLCVEAYLCMCTFLLSMCVLVFILYLRTCISPPSVHNNQDGLFMPQNMVLRQKLSIEYDQALKHTYKYWGRFLQLNPWSLWHNMAIIQWWKRAKYKTYKTRFSVRKFIHFTKVLHCQGVVSTVGFVTNSGKTASVTCVAPYI